MLRIVIQAGGQPQIVGGDFVGGDGVFDLAAVLFSGCLSCWA
ncbi:hypothetical protein [Kingella sp. (in: b-proteobacteria)]|nr:hypothetical protein [Kingella sp. (in: b-proteobacteria)]MDO4658532.1 hypothetical protein [Kingella sp. (in: b-proteobacteria)]